MRHCIREVAHRACMCPFCILTGCSKYLGGTCWYSCWSMWKSIGGDAVLPCEFPMRQIHREPGDEWVLLRMPPQWHRRIVECGCGPGVDGSRKELRMLVSFAHAEGDVGHSSGARPGGMPGELGDRCRWHLARLELRQQVPPQATPSSLPMPGAAGGRTTGGGLRIRCKQGERCHMAGTHDQHKFANRPTSI